MNLKHFFPAVVYPTTVILLKHKPNRNLILEIGATKLFYRAIKLNTYHVLVKTQHCDFAIFFQHYSLSFSHHDI